MMWEVLPKSVRKIHVELKLSKKMHSLPEDLFTSVTFVITAVAMSAFGSN